MFPGPNSDGGGIPRFPGPKFGWFFWLTTASVGLTPFGGSPLAQTPNDYWITDIDVYATTSGAQNEEFWIGIQPTIQPITVLQVFFGAQISPSTGLYFPWRGLLNWPATTELGFNNRNGGWSAYARGFFTPSEATQP